MSSERGGIITGWLLKLVLSIAIFGVCAFEAGAIVVAKVTIESTAGEAAQEAAIAYGRGGALDEATEIARDIAEREGAALESFDVTQNGQKIVVTVSMRAKTLILHRIGFTKDWTDARSTRSRGVP